MLPVILIQRRFLRRAQKYDVLNQVHLHLTWTEKRGQHPRLRGCFPGDFAAKIPSSGRCGRFGCSLSRKLPPVKLISCMPAQDAVWMT